MTTETQILQELVEAVSRPDWWAIGITAVNAVIVIVLTLWQLCLNKRQTKIQERQNELQEEQTRLQKQQNELQEQQIRQQEYEIYRRTYSLIKKADEEIDGFIDNIIYSLVDSSSRRSYEVMLKPKRTFVERLRNDLEQNFIDFEIKFSKDFCNFNAYHNILALMSSTLSIIDEVVQKDLMLWEKDSAQVVHAVGGNFDKGCVSYIIRHISDNADWYKIILRTHLNQFVKEKDKLREGGNDILEKIRERCKVE